VSISAVCFGMCHEFSLASISILFLSGAGKHGHVAKWISDFLEKLNSSDSSAHRRDFEATPFAVHANNNYDPAAQRLDGDVPRERVE
jgi:hypothetical protein